MVSEFSATDIKKMFGINNKTLSEFKLTPRTDSTKKGRPTDYYQFSEVLDKFVERHKRISSKIVVSPAGEKIDGELEQALYVRSKREAQELKNEVVRGEQASVAILSEVLNQITANLKTSLTSIPLNIKYNHPEISGSVIKHVERELIAVSNQISNQRIDWGGLESIDSEPGV